MMKNDKTALCPCLCHSTATEENNPQQCEVNQALFFTVTCLHMLKIKITLRHDLALLTKSSV